MLRTTGLLAGHTLCMVASARSEKNEYLWERIAELNPLGL